MAGTSRKLGALYHNDFGNFLKGVHTGLCRVNVQISLKASELVGPSNAVVKAENLRVSRKSRNQHDVLSKWAMSYVHRQVVTMFCGTSEG